MCGPEPKCLVASKSTDKSAYRSRLDSSIMLFLWSDNAYRLKESDADLPQIPVHPIGYEDAYHFLR
jgi:hypothetical protein